MFRLHSLAALTAVLAAVSVQARASLKYMPFGDSIAEMGCWRAQLWDKLQKEGFKDVDFVGNSKSATACSGLAYDKDHEGHSGFLAIDIASKKQLVGWLQKAPADIITMHLGTNDIGRSAKTTDIIAAFTTLVEQMRASNPKMRIIVSQIIPLATSYGRGNAGVQELNKAIPEWAASKNTTESPIWLVDQYTGMVSSDLKDGVHPGASGDTKMTDRWYPAVVAAIKSLQPAKREVEFSA